MAVVIIFCVLVYLIASFVIANEFDDIAFKKGYNEKKYFWYCLLFGIAGYLMVVALPIKKKSSEVDDERYAHISTSQNGENISQLPTYEFSKESGIEQCPNCGVCYDSNCNCCPSCATKGIE